jgi:hypothetical protein
VIAPLDAAKEKFAKAHKEREIILHNALAQYKFKTYKPPQIVIQEETYDIVDKQKTNRKNGLDFTKSWEQAVSENDKEMQEYFKLQNQVKEDTTTTPEDGKDWSLSTDGFKIYVASENKAVVNRDAFKDGDDDEIESEMINPMNPRGANWDSEYQPAEPEMEDEEGEQSSDEGVQHLDEPKTNNLDQVDFEKMTLDDFQGRPDQITKIHIVNVTNSTVEFKWDVPESNNSDIVEYTIGCKEVSLVHYLKLTFVMFSYLYI